MPRRQHAIQPQTFKSSFPKIPMWCQDQYTHSGWGNEHISAAGTDDPMERFSAVSHAVVKPWRVTTNPARAQDLFSLIRTICFTLLFIFLITSLRVSQPLITFNFKEDKYIVVENRVKWTEGRGSFTLGTFWLGKAHVLFQIILLLFQIAPSSLLRCLDFSKPSPILPGTMLLTHGPGEQTFLC